VNVYCIFELDENNKMIDPPLANDRKFINK